MFDRTNGCLLVNKPEGISSFGVIERIQQSLLIQGRKSEKTLLKRSLPKMGHGGTLDPFATGLLIVCIGNATRLSQYFLGSVKTYRGRIRFGATTSSGDPTGLITQTCLKLPQSLDELQMAANRFTLSPYLQTPPMHSAIKIDGKRLYNLARKGVEIERTPRECIIYEFRISSWNSPCAEYYVRCSAGTYVRTLGCDLAERIGSLSYLETLERTGSGDFELENALDLGSICQAMECGQKIEELTNFIDFDQMLSFFPSVSISPVETVKMRQGQKQLIHEFETSEIEKRLRPENLEENKPNQAVKLIDHSSGEVIALFSYQTDQKKWKLDRVFPFTA